VELSRRSPLYQPQLGFNSSISSNLSSINLTVYNPPFTAPVLSALGFLYDGWATTNCHSATWTIFGTCPPKKQATQWENNLKPAVHSANATALTVYYCRPHWEKSVLLLSPAPNPAYKKPQKQFGDFWKSSQKHVIQLVWEWPPIDLSLDKWPN